MGDEEPVRRSYFADKEFGRIRTSALVISIVLHGLIIFGLMYHAEQQAELAKEEQLKFGSSGGGGGEGANEDMIQFGSQGSTENENGIESISGLQLTLLQIHVYDDAVHATPVLQVETIKPKLKPRKSKPQPILADNLPTRWVRRGTGPGTGGGTGGGNGGGIGPGNGFSIDWGGAGSRRLLSGKIPKYPEGTNKQMTVILRFAVLPDGTVDAIVPTRKTDERLEGAAIAALRTWRFDPLPPQIDQKSQVGTATFTFKIE